MSDDTRRVIDAIDRLSNKVDRVADNLSSFGTICGVVEVVLVLFLIYVVSAILGCNSLPTT